MHAPIKTIYVYAVKGKKDHVRTLFRIMEQRFKLDDYCQYSSIKEVAEIPIENESDLSGFYNEQTSATEFQTVREVIRRFSSYKIREDLYERLSCYLTHDKRLTETGVLFETETKANPV